LLPWFPAALLQSPVVSGRDLPDGRRAGDPAETYSITPVAKIVGPGNAYVVKWWKAQHVQNEGHFGRSDQRYLETSFSIDG
jgi:hypothetical protein